MKYQCTLTVHVCRRYSLETTLHCPWQRLLLHLVGSLISLSPHMYSSVHSSVLFASQCDSKTDIMPCDFIMWLVWQLCQKCELYLLTTNHIICLLLFPFNYPAFKHSATAQVVGLFPYFSFLSILCFLFAIKLTKTKLLARVTKNHVYLDC